MGVDPFFVDEILHCFHNFPSYLHTSMLRTFNEEITLLPGSCTSSIIFRGECSFFSAESTAEVSVGVFSLLISKELWELIFHDEILLT